MPTKQSNKQTQNVNVVVNNKMCCDKPKPKKRRAKPKPPPREASPTDQEPIDEFPVLNTPQARTNMPNIAPLPVRQTVYIPNSIQISPDGVNPPLPPYFDRPFTNLTRTVEDMRSTLMNEINDVRSLIGSRGALPLARPITHEMGTDPQDLSTIDPNPFGSPTETPMGQSMGQSMVQPQTPTSAMTTPSPSMTYQQPTSPFMSFMMNRQHQEPTEISPLPTQQETTPSTLLTMSPVFDMFDIPPQTKLQKHIQKYPEYVEKYNTAPNMAEKKKWFEKIKKVGNHFNLIETRGVSMLEYIRRVGARINANPI